VLMENERIQFLRDSLASKPGDTFARYALAIELVRGGKPEEAWEHFRYLLEHHPDYSASYYQAGALLANQGRKEEARQVLSKGIEVTARLGQKHAHGELMDALANLD
jgi:Flp pilus assembly protein TadD